MTLRTKIDRTRRSLASRWRKVFRHRRSTHDPMLVFNMSIFNSASRLGADFQSIEDA
jgi:hypothetical protein